MDWCLRFFEAYAAKGVNFWGLSVQNEPSTGFLPKWGWQTMYLSPKMQRYSFH